jgi:hypothetical protein
VYTVPALAVLVPRRDAMWLRTAGSRAWFGAALVALFAAWPVRLQTSGGWSSAASWSASGLLRFQAHGGRAELHWNTAELVLGDYYVIAGSLLIACVGGALVLTSRGRSAEAAGDVAARARLST